MTGISISRPVENTELSQIAFDPEEEGRFVLFDFGASGKEGEKKRWGPGRMFSAPEQFLNNPMSRAGDMRNLAVVIELVRTRKQKFHCKLSSNEFPSELFLRAIEMKMGKNYPEGFLEKLLDRQLKRDPCYEESFRKYQKITSQEMEKYEIISVDFSGDLGALLQKMFTFEPRERITAEAALEDSYFIGN